MYESNIKEVGQANALVSEIYGYKIKLVQNEEAVLELLSSYIENKKGTKKEKRALAAKLRYIDGKSIEQVKCEFGDKDIKRFWQKILLEIKEEGIAGTPIEEEIEQSKSELTFRVGNKVYGYKDIEVDMLGLSYLTMSGMSLIGVKTIGDIERTKMIDAFETKGINRGTMEHMLLEINNLGIHFKNEF